MGYPTMLKLSLFRYSMIFLCAVGCKTLSFSEQSSTNSELTLKSGLYQSPVGAGKKLSIGPIAGAGPELRVIDSRQSAPIVLQSQDGINWNFSGKGGCTIGVKVTEANKIYVNHSGPCEYYGLPLDLDLTGPYFAK